jgi:hypothetical protein
MSVKDCDVGSSDSRGFFLGPANIVPNVSQSRSILDVKTDCQQLEKVTDDRSVSSRSDYRSARVGDVQRQISIGATDLAKFIAFGSLHVWRFSGQEQWHRTISGETTLFPPIELLEFQKRGWLRIEYVPVERHESDTTSNAVARIYILPEDVDRASRASPKPFRKVVKWLIAELDTSLDAWEGRGSSPAPPKRYGVSKEAQEESLFYIFNTLESPRLQPDWWLKVDRHVYQAMDDILNDNILGLTTKLYPYQKNSVSYMLQREARPAMSQDPRKVEYTDVTEKFFYMDIIDAIVTKDPHLYVEPRGGILAETMGYGKTLATLALVLATRGFYPSVPETRIEKPPTSTMQPQTSSLMSMAAKAVRHYGVPWKAKFFALQQQGYYYERCITELQKHHREFGEPIFHPSTPGRYGSRRDSERTIKICGATLIVVPQNLLVQWKQEIEEHIEPEALKYLVLDSSKEPIPQWQTLMEYDIVLITKPRLDHEERDDDLHQGRRQAGSARFVSPLTELRWLRVVCDEGHSFASSTTRTKTMAMLDKLSIERRWIISGTPSSSLHGIDVDLAVDASTSNGRRDSLEKALERRRVPESQKQEENDMERLRLIVVKFLKVQPWANQTGDSANWKKYMSPFDAHGQRRTSPGLRILLQGLMVRHRIKDLDADVTLPPLHNTTVYLEPTYYDKLVLNLFALVLTSNAVTSEREDEDYMFHPKNRQSLERLIGNLRQSTFHWVGFTADDIREAAKRAETYLDEHLETVTDADGCLLSDALSTACRTVEDRRWTAFSVLHEMGVFVEQFPDDASESWSIIGEKQEPLLLGSVQALAAQQYVRKNIHNDPLSGLIGAGMKAMSEAQKRAASESEKANDKANKAAKAAHPSSEPPPQQLGTAEQPKVRISLARQPSTAAERPSTPAKRPRTESLTSPTTATTNAISATRVTGFTSAKLTYLCSSILSLPPTTKCLIFYDSNNNAFWIAEALELLGIQHLIYSNTLRSEKRAEYLRMFNTEPQWRVLLMDLKQASTGLHVASASRVWILTPIWRREVEAQAIKRAHRIGQVNEVKVETLVLKGTIEERMWQRRKGVSEAEVRRKAQMKAGGSTGGPQNIGSGGWLEDEGVVGIIKNEKFLHIGDEETGDGKEAACRLAQPVRLFRDLDIVDRQTTEYSAEDDRETRNSAGLVSLGGKKRKLDHNESAGAVGETPVAVNFISEKPGVAEGERHQQRSIFGGVSSATAPETGAESMAKRTVRFATP